jgi:hypothetical protein
MLAGSVGIIDRFVAVLGPFPSLSNFRGEVAYTTFDSIGVVAPG